jgi:hypothetical protein
MRRKNTELLKDVLNQFLQQNKLDKPLLEKRAIDAWQVVLGKNIVSYTSNISIKYGVLYVTVSSSVLRQDLFMSRAGIIQSINKHIGSEIVKDIVFR